MASSKDIFEANIFEANIFAAGIFRGLGVDATTVSAPVSAVREIIRRSNAVRESVAQSLAVNEEVIK